MKQLSQAIRPGAHKELGGGAAYFGNKSNVGAATYLHASLAAMPTVLLGKDSRHDDQISYHAAKNA